MTEYVPPPPPPLRPGAVPKYSHEVECPLIAIRMIDGSFHYHERELHDWRCLSTEDGLLWYCTRCQKISTKQPRKPRKKKP